MATSPISLVDILDLRVDVDVIDVGANPIDGEPPYRPLILNGLAHVVGFEPNPEALNELQRVKGPHETYLPYVIGDGHRHTLHLCRAPGMTSLLEPNRALLTYFHGFPEWGEVLRTEEVETVALDDVHEISDADLLKIDIQGAELMVFRHAPRVLQRCVVVHTEVEFLPMYIGQPLFSEVEQHLRAAGFVLHKFDSMESRAVAPMAVNGDIYRGLGQVFWADAIFVRDFTRPEALSDEKLLKLCIILHDMYKSYDIVFRLLQEHDRRRATRYGDRYIVELESSPQ